MNRALAAATVTLAILTSAVGAVAGITRSCGPDAVANTAAILCTAPSGPCDATSIVVGVSLTLTDGPCRFDLGGRSLRIDRTLQIRIDPGHLDNRISIEAAGDVTLARGARLKARGDFAPIEGQFTSGGFIEIHSAGTVRLAGLVDMSGDSGGAMEIHTEGDVVFEPHGKIRGNGRTKLSDMGLQLTDGAYLLVAARSGSISFAGRVQMRGGNAGSGGSMDMVAGRELEVSGKIDLTGGGFGGGDIGLTAADHLRISGAKIDARSRGGGADGGLIFLDAGQLVADDDTPVVGADAVGHITIERALFNVDGSANQVGTAGAGGDVLAFAYGNIDVTDLTVRANGAASTTTTDGYGGTVYFQSDPVPSYLDPAGHPIAFDLLVSGRISARGGGPEGLGGEVDLFADGHIVDAATIDAGGRLDGGEIFMVAGGDLDIRAPINAAADVETGEGGSVQLAAGRESVGRLTIASDLRARGGTRSAVEPAIDLRGCPVDVADGVTIDAQSGVGPGGEPGTPTLALVSGRPMLLGDGSRYLAGPAGTISASHPPTLGPIIGTGVEFDPPLLDLVVPSSAFPTCPRCGDGPGDDCGPRVRIDGIASSGDALTATVVTESPLGLPLAGTAEICDGPGVEDVTFTWLARGCDPHDVFELLVNDVVVAEVPPESGPCECPFGPQSYTVPIADVASLLTAGANRFGVRKTAAPIDQGCRLLTWAYATVTHDGVATRVPIFHTQQPPFAPLGADPFAATDACQYTGASCGAVEAGAATVLCGAPAATAWTGALPCGLDLSGLAADHDYTLVVRATDGVVAEPALAARDFTRAGESAMTLNAAACP